MMISTKELFRREETSQRVKGLLAIEQIALVYLLFTTVLTLVYWDRIPLPQLLIGDRLTIVLFTAALWCLYKVYPCKLMRFVRIVSQLGLLSYWYSNTYDYNSLFSNLDYLFAGWEQQLFHCQPAIWFSSHFPSAWVSEPLNMGYFSYYPMMGVVMFFYFLCRNPRFEEASFILLCSFFIYYVVYIFLPVAGPQYYFQAVGVEQILQEHFPHLGHYFATHTEMLTAPGWQDGVFYKLVASAQAGGERPTAAFPSSHIGISLILLILSFRTKAKLGWMLLPFVILLCGATVYIQAHYLIDAIAGVVSSVVVYFLSSHIYKRWFQPKSKN